MGSPNKLKQTYKDGVNDTLEKVLNILRYRSRSEPSLQYVINEIRGLKEKSFVREAFEHSMGYEEKDKEF